MKKLSIKLALIALFCSGTANAQGYVDIWQNSYALEKIGQYGAAAAAMDSVLRSSPTHELALMRHAWLNYLQGRYNDAVIDYNHLLSLNPKSLDGRLGLTLPLLAQKRWHEAAIEANKVIAVSAWDYTAHIRLMATEEGTRQWETLAHHAAELVAHYPGDTMALVYLARSLAWQSDIKGARAAYVKVLEHLPEHLEALDYLKNNPVYMKIM